ncbi:MAG: sigma-70 family RNA polymerase sigma factor [Oscillospiraceae bacterium]|jgi:RNA polymerase sigma factor (sigma-70 family)|nr:sigma-70 family RNA polymerase sigma factor [Oscillospiraceae bacterium]
MCYLPIADQERIRKQFDCLMKRVLGGESKNAHIEIARQAERETMFSELTENQHNSLSVTDEYPSDKTRYQVMGFDVDVRGDLLTVALDTLPPNKRDVILLAYFMNMTDVEIARITGFTPANIHYHRTSALKKLKNFLEKEDKPHEQ